jgi:hypothetical protein
VVIVDDATLLSGQAEALGLAVEILSHGSSVAQNIFPEREDIRDSILKAAI